MHSSAPICGPAQRRSTTLALLVVGLDQATKLGVELFTGGHRHGLLVPVRNDDFSLGLVGAPTPIELLAMAAGIALIVVYGLRLLDRGLLPAWIPGLVVGGALSNGTDRLLLGSVRDFLAIGHLAVNLADLTVLAGLFGFALAHLSHKPAAPILREEVQP
jgi:lipoprotein signal peptidase